MIITKVIKCLSWEYGNNDDDDDNDNDDADDNANNDDDDNANNDDDDDDDDNDQPSAVHGRKETPGAARALRPEGLKA